MSPKLIQLGFVAFISSAIGAPHGFVHHAKPSGSGVPFEAGNMTDCTMVHPSGTGRAGHHHHRYCIRPTGTGAMNEALAGTSTVLDTAVVTSTVTNVITVSVTPEKASATSSVAPASPSSAGPATTSVAISSPTDIASTVFASSVSSSTANPVEAVSSSLNLGQNAYSQPTTMATSVAASSSAVASSAPATTSSASSSSGSSSGGKRGIPFNDVQYTTAFSGKKVTWAYNWLSSTSGLGSGFEYVPMLWGTSSSFTNSWQSDAKKAIAAGTTHLLGFNEPDLPAQANLSPAAAAAAYKTYLSDMFGGSSVRLGSPGVTNGGGSMGLSWLSSFMSACSGCQIDFVAIHWYDSATNIDYFKQHVTDAHTQTGKPVWLTEFGASGSDDQINTFLQTVIPWLESQSFVERYAYFMAKDGLLNSGSSLSTYGNTYATA